MQRRNRDMDELQSNVHELEKEFTDIIAEETHLPSKYIAIGVKQGVMAVAFLNKQKRLEDLPAETVKRYKKTRNVMLQLHPMMNETSVSDFDEGFQLATRAIVKAIHDTNEFGNGVKEKVLRVINDQFTALGRTVE